MSKSMTRKDGAGVTVTIESLSLRKGVAGQVSAVARVRHDWEANDSHDVSTWECVCSAFGGPVVAILSDGYQMFVRDPGRFGAFADDPR